MASETVRHLTKGHNLELFDKWITNCTSQIVDAAFRFTLSRVWGALKSRVAPGQDERELAAVLGIGRQIMFTLAWLVGGVLLALDAQRDGDGVASEVARRWILEGQGVPGEFAFTDLIYQRSVSAQDVTPTARERTEWDCRIVWGVALPSNASAGYRASKI